MTKNVHPFVGEKNKEEYHALIGNYLNVRNKLEIITKYT
jgi:hypothetical protein